MHLLSSFNILYSVDLQITRLLRLKKPVESIKALNHVLYICSIIYLESRGHIACIYPECLTIELIYALNIKNEYAVFNVGLLGVLRNNYIAVNS